jgi:hypothetical protein
MLPSDFPTVFVKRKSSLASDPYISVFSKAKAEHSPGNISLALIMQPPVLHWTVQLPHIIIY